MAALKLTIEMRHQMAAQHPNYNMEITVFLWCYIKWPLFCHVLSKISTAIMVNLFDFARLRLPTHLSVRLSVTYLSRHSRRSRLSCTVCVCACWREQCESCGPQSEVSLHVAPQCMCYCSQWTPVTARWDCYSKIRLLKLKITVQWVLQITVLQ